jgi:hypothetical protein
MRYSTVVVTAVRTNVALPRRTTGERPVRTDGLTLACHRSPVDELTAGSNELAVAVIPVIAFSFGTPLAPNGPTTSGATSQAPGATGWP